jgi:transposase
MKKLIRRPRRLKAQVPPLVARDDAAGVDLGAMLVTAALPPSRPGLTVRTFATFTPDLQALVAWFQANGIRTVAMEATSVYWIPLYTMLEDAGIEICLVNARHLKNVPGRKTDVADAQWLQQLHAVGLLHASFHPPVAIRVVRTFWRQRDALVREAARQVQLMHKALDQMNLHVHHVLSDLMGESGSRMVTAILAGERDAATLARLRDHRVKASEATLIKALTGDYRTEHLFCLQQAHDSFGHFQTQIAACDRQIETELARLQTVTAAPLPAAARVTGGKKDKTTRKDSPQPKFDLRAQLYRICGVDLTAVPGINLGVATTVVAEVGVKFTAFKTSKHFCSWLRVAPDPRVSGGQIIGGKVPRGSPRAARAFRLAAHSLHSSHSPLGDIFRRFRAKLGAAAAITALAHKLARIVYHLLTTRQAYEESKVLAATENYRVRQEASLRKRAHSLGYQIIPLQPTIEVVP